jgi:transcriptional regulator with XRE-family HTH domain
MKAGRAKLSEQVRSAIRASGLSQNQLGRESGVDVATINRFLRGKGGLSQDVLDKIADVLGLNLTTEQRSRKTTGG